MTQQFMSLSFLTIIATTVTSQHIFFVPTLHVYFEVECAFLVNGAESCGHSATTMS